MDQSKIQYFEKVDSQQQREFVISQSNCILCGTVLELKHQTLETSVEIKEEAFCPHCDVKTRAKTHILN